MVTEVASSLLLLTSTSHKWLCFGCQDISHAPVNWPSPPLTLLQMSLLSASHIYMHRGVHTQTHTHQHACRRPICQCLAHSAFLLPPDWRTEVAREGQERRELRGKTAGHMMRSDLFTNPRQNRARTRGGRERRVAGSLWTPLRIGRGRGEACHGKASWRWERLNATHADTLVYTHSLCLWFFFLNWRSRWLEGE